MTTHREPTPIQLSTYVALVEAREEAARRLAALRAAEQLVRDRREDFTRAKKVVHRFQQRHIRARQK